MGAHTYLHFDPDGLLADLFDNIDIVRSVLDTFAKWKDSVHAELRAAIDNADAVHLARITHTLRGSLAQIHARPALKLSRALEARCKNSTEFRPHAADTEALQRELQAVADDIAHYLASI